LEIEVQSAAEMKVYDLRLSLKSAHL